MLELAPKELATVKKILRKELSTVEVWAFSDSNLPFQVDVVDWSHIDDDFKQLLNKKHLVLQNPTTRNQKN